jgi:GxxExxY protein
MIDSNECYYKNDETYKLIGICMEVHRILGPGLLEIVYKDAIEVELKDHRIPYTREKEFEVEYKGILLPHKFYADFVIYDDIILEVKSVKEISNDHIAQTINYIKLAQTPIGIIANFQNKSLVHKRLINKEQI